MRKLRIIILAFATILPSRLKIALLRCLFGWDIDPTAYIGLALFVNVRQVRLGPGAFIGHFNVFRNLEKLEIGADGGMANWNWMSAAEEFARTPEHRDRGNLRIGPHAVLTSRHYLDCSGGIQIGAFSTVAGMRSTLLTHEIDTKINRQTTAQITIGEYCFIGSDVRVTAGSRIPDRCAIAMGAVVTGELTETDTLYGGVPARPLKKVGDDAYFHRETGVVSP